ncbi:hypothetical protein NQ317_000140, partial [Molorchus minor]
MDDSSDTSSNYLRDSDKEDQDILSQGCGSDPAFPQIFSNATTPKEKLCPNAVLDEVDCAKLTRTKWTASFRKINWKIK